MAQSLQTPVSRTRNVRRSGVRLLVYHGSIGFIFRKIIRCVVGKNGWENGFLDFLAEYLSMYFNGDT